jgi:predicted N-acetyltransferase YhbS
MDRDQRRAENEAAFRAVNERIAELGRRVDADPLDLICECSNADCVGAIRMTRVEYERLRSHPAHFVVLRGHESNGIERVVEQTDGYSVVEKRGEAAEIAAAFDPRS